jgi:regulatory protein YycI of two-component signal transduction system YycFG
MTTTLVVVLILIDLVLLGVIYLMGRQRGNSVDVLKDIYEEKKVLKELRTAIHEEMGRYQIEGRELHKKMQELATEAEMEIKSSGETLSKELDRLLDQLSDRVTDSVEGLGRHRSNVSALIQKSKQERELLNKAVSRAEKLIQFFKRKVPVEEVLEEIEDKKYCDARHLLAKGLSIADVSAEVGLPESEVKLLATVVP